MKKIKFLLALFLISAVASAQAVNFSGTWKINSEKSKLNYDFSLGPKQIVMVQKGNDLSVEKLTTLQSEDYTTNDNLTLDGKESVNTFWQDTQKKSTVAWSDDKKSLKITSKLTTDNGDVTIMEVYRMDGKNMILESSISSANGDMSEMMCYDKQ